MNNLFGKIRMFFYLLKKIKGPAGRVKFTYALWSDLAFPFIFKRRRREYEVRFKRFHLKWRVGCGELTPYPEIEKVFSSGIFIPDEIKDWTIIDCGANIGLFSLFFKDAKKIIAIEANRECCDRLTHNFKKNKVSGYVISKAVSREPDYIRMNITDNSSVLSKVDCSGNTSVEATTIDDIIDRCKLNRVDLLKLDIEGHEIEALKGAGVSLRSGTIKRIYSEFQAGESLEKLDAFLNPLRYKRTATIDYNALYQLEPKP